MAIANPSLLRSVRHDVYLGPRSNYTEFMGLSVDAGQVPRIRKSGRPDGEQNQNNNIRYGEDSPLFATESFHL